MAAQERAKQAQMKQTNAPIEQTSTTMLPAPTQMEVNTQQRKEKTMSAFDNLVDPSMTNKETEKPSLPLSQLAQLSVSQQQQMGVYHLQLLAVLMSSWLKHIMLLKF